MKHVCFQLNIMSIVWISYAPSKQSTGSHQNRKNKHHEHSSDRQPSSFLCQRRMSSREMTQDHKTGWRWRVSHSPLWPLSHRWHSRALPSPAQTPGVAFLASAAEHNGGSEILSTWDQTVVKMAECLNTICPRGNAKFGKLADWHFPARLHQLVSQSLAPKLWLSGSSKVRGETQESDAMKSVRGAMIYHFSDFGIQSVSCFLLNLNTYFSELSLR